MIAVFGVGLGDAHHDPRKSGQIALAWL
jgi:hypothetical protein